MPLNYLDHSDQLLRTTRMHRVQYPVSPELLSTRLAWRCCRTPDCKSVVAAWLLYEDVNDMYPCERGWENPETPDPPPFEIRPVDSKGRGMIATRKIKCGELIVRERPVIMVPRKFASDPKMAWHEMDRWLLQLLYFLKQEDREKFVQLRNCKSLDECGPLSGIVRTNAIAATFPFSETCHQYCSVCLNISCVNHSCVPNAYHDFEEMAITNTLCASRDIAEGEEITISYINSCLPVADRQDHLQKSYCFTCTCSLCSNQTASSAASEKRRKFINRILDNAKSMWTDWLDCPQNTRPSRTERDIKIFESVLRAMDEENLRDRRITALQHLAFMYGALGDLNNFRKWGKECLKDLEAEKDTKDSDPGTSYRLWQSWIRNPRSFWVWRMCA